MHTALRQLEVIVGCMFSGKTEELIRRLERVRIANRGLLLFKPTIDDRYGVEFVQTHYGRSLRCYLLDPDTSCLNELVVSLGQQVVGSCDVEGTPCSEDFKNHEAVLGAGQEALDQASVIAFDEGQFFSGGFPGLCEELVGMGKRVIVAGLDLDFVGKPFGPIPELLALADKVEKLQAVCVVCGGVANRTQRLDEKGKPVKEDEGLIVVGGADRYEARCRECYEAPA